MQLHNLSTNVQGDERVIWTFRELENLKVHREYSSPRKADNIIQSTSREFIYDNDDNLVEEITTIQATDRADRINTTRHEYNKQHRIIRSIATSKI
jgi:hypothetical protein